jgi:hypothetical protein
LILLRNLEEVADCNAPSYNLAGRPNRGRLAAMRGIEYRKGTSTGPKETSIGRTLEEELASARTRARQHGADNIRVTDAAGKEIGVFPVAG